MNDFNLDNGFTTPIKKKRDNIVMNAPEKKKIVFYTPKKDETISEFDENNPLLLAPKKNKIKTFFKNMCNSSNHL